MISITSIGLTIWSTIYEESLLRHQNADNDSLSHSRQAIHPVDKPTQMPIIAKANGGGVGVGVGGGGGVGQRIYSFENQTIDLESNDAALKKDKIHSNHILNGCTFELHPITIENNNGNHLSNNNNNHTNNNRHFYRLNNNNRNGIHINNNHNTGNNCNNDDVNDNMKMVQHQNGSSYATKSINDDDMINHLSKFLFFFSLDFQSILNKQ